MRSLKNWVFPALAFLLFSCSQASNKNKNASEGVEIGAITYSYRSMPDQSIPAILEYITQSGIQSVELMGGPVEAYAGIPQEKDPEVLSQWRTSVSMDTFKDIKKLFDQKGIKVHILKLGSHKWSDKEIDYAFEVCKIFDAKGISMEISHEAAQRMAPFAEKHNRFVIFHNHAQPGDPAFKFEDFLAYSPKFMLNFDAGHYFGATGLHPNTIIEKLHDRIVSIHIKDKTAKTAPDPDKNRPLGEGNTPLAEIFGLIQKEGWPIHCDIELEYKIPEDSDAVKEVTKCVEYCRELVKESI